MRIGIIGGGMIGSTLARLWVEAPNDHEVFVSSRHPERLEPLVAELGKRTCCGTPEEAVTWAEVVVLAIPLAATAGLSNQVKGQLEGKVVLDANNPFERRDGAAAQAVEQDGRGSGRWTADQLPGARVVKAFNTVYYQRMANREGCGVPLAGDDAEALEVAAGLVRDAGMVPVLVGGLDRAAAFDPGSRVWNSAMKADELRTALDLDAPANKEA